MPAAAVTPAPIAYIKVVAVKKLVVGYLARMSGPPLNGVCAPEFPCHPSEERPSRGVTRIYYFEKIRVFKAGVCLNTLAWNNKIGLRFYFVGFVGPE